MGVGLAKKNLFTKTGGMPDHGPQFDDHSLTTKAPKLSV